MAGGKKEAEDNGMIAIRRRRRRDDKYGSIILGWLGTSIIYLVFIHGNNKVARERSLRASPTNFGW